VSDLLSRGGGFNCQLCAAAQ